MSRFIGYIHILIWVLLLLVNPGPSVVQGDDKVKIQYLKSTQADLVGAFQSVSVTNQASFHNSDLSQAKLNTNPLSNLLIISQGSQRATCQAPLIMSSPDQTHTSALITYDHDGSVLDQSIRMLMVDDEPPELELLSPTASKLGTLPQQFVVRVKDTQSGVSFDPDENKAVAFVQKRPAHIRFQLSDEGMLMLITSPFYSWVGGRSIQLEAYIQDRAGNKGSLNQDFEIEYFEQEWVADECELEVSFTRWNLWSVQEMVDVTLQHSITADAKNGLAIHKVEISYGVETAKTDGEYWRFALRQMADRTTFDGTSPFYLSVDRKVLFDFPTKKALTVRFTIKQHEAVRFSNSIYRLPISYPIEAGYDLETYETCYLREFLDNNIENLKEEGPLFRMRMRSVEIPIRLQFTAEKYEHKVEQKDKTVLFRITTPQMPYPIDARASWFAVESNAAILDETSHGFEAVVPVEREGSLPWKAEVTCKGCVLGSGNDSIDALKGMVWVRLDPPTISNFHYDRHQEMLIAEIEDEGTPLKKLTTRLRVFGAGELSFEIDPATGILKAPYALPYGVHQAILTVRDAANQSVSETCTIFGLVEDPGGIGPVTDPADDNIPDWEEIDEFHSDVEDGPDSVVAVNRYQGNFNHVQTVQISDSFSTGRRHNYSRADQTNNRSATYYRQYRNGLQRTRVCTLARPHCPDGYDVEVEYAQCVDCWDQCRRLSVDAGDATVQYCRQNCGENAIGMGQTLAEICNRSTMQAFCGRSNIGIRNDEALGLPISSTTQCRDEWRDTLAPRIFNLRMDGPQQVRASIHDHGQPLRLLNIEIEVYLETDFAWVDHTDRVDFQFDTRSGLFHADLNLPPESGELLAFFIRVNDQAGNSSVDNLQARLARKPPDLKVEVVRVGDEIYLNESPINAYLKATAADGSYIDGSRTRIWIDEVPVIPFAITPGAFQRNVVGADHRVIPSEPPYVCTPWTAFFGALLSEGLHNARVRVYDTAGLWTEKEILFDIQYHPRITDFRAHHDQVQAAGGTAFTARIRDAGRNLDPTGIKFRLDGNWVDETRCHYDPASGYFAVDGPFELTGYQHQATILAMDRLGRRAEATINFRVGHRIAPPAAVTGRIALESISLWELENHNGDGRANPGELVRLFVTLRNLDETYALESVQGFLASREIGIIVEQAAVAYGTLLPGQAPSPLTGFDLRIDPDFLADTAADPYPAGFTLMVQSNRGQATQIGFSLPIERPTLPATYTTPIETSNSEEEALQNPISVVRVRLDRTPPTVRETTLAVSGRATSSLYDIQTVVAMVGSERIELDWRSDENRFYGEVDLVPGQNFIYVEAYDESGAMGMDSTRVNCIPDEEPPLEPPPVEEPPVIASEVTILLNMDRLPPTTTLNYAQVWGRALSSESVISMVEMAVNGGSFIEANRWNSLNGRFRDRVDLILGDNLIEVRAYDESGASATVSHTITRIVEPLSLTITVPENGAHYGHPYPYPYTPGDEGYCSFSSEHYTSIPSEFEGTFNADPERITAFRFDIVGSSSHSGDIEVLPSNNGTYRFEHGVGVTGGNTLKTYVVTVILETEGGQSIARTRTFTFYMYPYCL